MTRIKNTSVYLFFVNDGRIEASVAHTTEQGMKMARIIKAIEPGVPVALTQKVESFKTTIL